MDFSTWDYATSFTGEQIAALIVGISLDDLGFFQSKVSPVMTRLDGAFRDGLRKCWDRHSVSNAHSRPEYGGNDLVGGFVEGVEEMARRGADEDELHLEIEGLWDRFSQDSFTRASVVRWLRETGLPSEYRFAIGEPTTNDNKTTATRWPWGDHHTEALGHLEAAARKFWGPNYDPTDPTTASTNAHVKNWLKSERRVSDNLAASIASILRDDKLRPGPR